MSDISRLGYIGLEVSDLAAWERFAVDALGLTIAARHADGSLALQMDEQARRIVVHPGERDDLAYVGFEVDDENALRELVATLSAAGLSVTEGKPETAEARQVEQLFQLEDPNGVPIEIFRGPAAGDQPFRSELVPSGFCTGDEGLGHVVIVARDAKDTENFYRELLGMKLSDRIAAEPVPGLQLDLTFLHSNPRHHTVAFVAAPLPKRIHHFMVEVNSMEDVGKAYDRCRDAGFQIANELGQHPNDLMFSFYAKAPSGFDVEFGWGGRKVNDAVWEVGSYDRTSTWGHRPPTAPTSGVS